ncbi:histidine kinase N-terminal 7TM domain-containing protein, partial [Chloroflexota bacterium]
MQYTPYILPLIVSAVIIFFLMVYAVRHRETNTAKLFAAFMLALLFWVASVIFEMMAVKLEHKLLADFGFIGIAPAPAIWLALTLVYTNRTPRLKWLVITLLGLAIVTNIMIWTNDLHHLWRGNPSLDTTSGPFPIVLYDYGPWFHWVYLPANYMSHIISIVLILWSLFIAKPTYRQQIWMLLLAFLVVIAADALYILGLTPIPNFNLAPVAFSIAGLIIAWSLFRYQFLDLMPVARDVVVENMNDVVIVLDNENRVVDFNPAVRQRLSMADATIIGQPVERLLPDQTNLIERYKDTSEVNVEIMLADERCFDLRISPLRRRGGRLSGKVVMLHDITARKQVEQALQDDYNQLQILRQVDIELSQSLATDYVLGRALDAAARMSGADSITISLAEGDVITVVGGLGDVAQLIGLQLSADSGITGRVLRQQQSELVLDVNADPDYLATNPQTRAQMTLPLVAHNRLLGVLNLETAHPERFSSKTFEFVRLLSTRMAVALDNAYAYSEMAQLVEDLDAFAHTVAHDLKNPLGLVLGYANILADDAPS